MKHVIALDVSIGKSTIVIYDGYKRCEYEGIIEHNHVSLLNHYMNDYKQLSYKMVNYLKSFSKLQESIRKDLKNSFRNISILTADSQST